MNNTGKRTKHGTSLEGAPESAFHKWLKAYRKEKAATLNDTLYPVFRSFSDIEQTCFFAGKALPWDVEEGWRKFERIREHAERVISEFQKEEESHGNVDSTLPPLRVANAAQLVVAAPELYAALVDAIEALEQGREYQGEVLEVIAGAREALAKARGEQ
jgi:hypothetical protein